MLSEFRLDSDWSGQQFMAGATIADISEPLSLLFIKVTFEAELGLNYGLFIIRVVTQLHRHGL